MNVLPEEFINTAADILGPELPSFTEALQQTPPVSIRLNTVKTNSHTRFGATQMPYVPAANKTVLWNSDGIYLDARPSFTDDPLFHAGAYYVQEASSMFVGHIVRSLQLEPAVRILDLCAAPGGKATLYSELAGIDGLVVANEVVSSRASVLADNVRKWGIGNTMVTNNDPSHIGVFREWFDIVGVDAPCSGEGMFRKNADATGEWSSKNVAMCAARQRRIVADIWDALRPGGILIYSTCTFNREENEDNVRWMTENFDCEDAGITVPAEWGIAETDAGGIKCFRFWPHRVKGEGFFASAIRKCGDSGRSNKSPKARRSVFTKTTAKETEELDRWIENPERMQYMHIGDNCYGFAKDRISEIRSIAENLNTIYSGVCMGQIFGGRLKPDHSLAMYHGLNRHSVHETELTLPESLQYLKRTDITSATDRMQEGINLLSYYGHALGWAKRIGNRCNNLYPKSQMILHR